MFLHEPQKFNPSAEKPDHLHWLHTIVSNVKASIAGTYHGFDPEQAYLNEFCYRFSRRHFQGQLFNRLLSCFSNTPTITYSELYITH